MSIRIRSGTSTDVPFLRQMLYEAAYWRGGSRPGVEVGLSPPELRKLLAGWGREGDLAVVAEAGTEPVGAAWLRFWDDRDHSFGYVSSEIPELGIGVAETHRGMGIGRKLLERLLLEAARAGVNRVSLSVERDNPALHLYETSGFKTVGVVGTAYTMVASAGAA
jgi:ribosomal protein S18 acetylase RimI-like enzyme